MKRLLLALFAGLLLTAPTSAFAYVYTYTCGPSWASLPVPYWINSAGSGDLPFGTVETIMEESFLEWGKPCCSNFAAEYRGTTSLTATNNQGRVVLSFVENSWNPQWGSVNETIGITFSSVYNNCSIAEAPILFNGVGFRFTNGGGGTDLQSIATHEIGHLLGLGHSQIQNATMFYAYSGGTASRSLHQDDQDGVCSLYTRSCSCSSNSQCFNGEQCIGGQCQQPPCQSDADCDTGLSCNTGTGACGIPPCASDADCSGGFTCNGNICVSACPVCRKNCADNGDCGANGFCVDNTDGSKVCLVLCGQNSECPGDAACYVVDDGQGGDAYVCGDPNATSSLCPDDYVCQNVGVTNACNAAADCPAGQLCVNTTDGRRCEVPEDPCADVMCGEGLFCDNGICIREDISNNVPGNNTSANNTPGNNTPGNNTPGNNNTGTGGDDDPIIVVFAAEDEPDEGCCSVTRRREVPGGLLLLIGSLFWARRRRR